eukprot:TRINITY_DN137_c0_g1_i1.p1 TRINITY_DN137_c0_g1~~TRINITY_DN137_c0_g1_i1.p1  ORF type:complete len:741 (+),score=187.79 TRINITY_DN137_c0_g1_i1:104-2224(+)
MGEEALKAGRTDSEINADLWEAGVEFQTPNDDFVRFVPTGIPGELDEYLCTRDASEFTCVGTATELFIQDGKLTDQDGGGGMLPSDDPELILRLKDLCEWNSVPLHIASTRTHGPSGLRRPSDDYEFFPDEDSQTPLPPPSWDPTEEYATESGSTVGAVVDAVQFAVENGAVVRFVATDGQRGALREYLRNGPHAPWEHVGTATALIYDVQEGTISDQDGGGGKLPPDQVEQLVAALRRCALSAGVPFGVRGANLAGQRRVRGRRSRGNSSPAPPQKRALVIGAAGGVSGIGALMRAAYDLADLGRRCFSGVTMRTICEGGAEEPTRQVVLRELEWLAAGARTGDTLFLGLVCRGYPTQWRPGQQDVALSGGMTIVCSDGLTVTSNELRALCVDPLPAGAWLTIVCDAAPPASVVDLPYKLIADENGFNFGENVGITMAQKCTVVQLSMVQSAHRPARERPEAGMLVQALRAVLEPTVPPTYAELADALRNQLPGGQPMVSATHSFDALHDCFTLAGPCRPRGLGDVDPALDFDDGDRRTFWRGFVRAFDTLSAPQGPQGEDAASSAPYFGGTAAGAQPPPQPVGGGSPLERLIRGFYVRHAPEKRRLAQTLVNEFPGRALELLQMLARKYNDTSVLNAYDPLWDAPPQGSLLCSAPYLRAEPPQPAGLSPERPVLRPPVNVAARGPPQHYAGLSAIGRRDAWDVI